MASIGRWLIRVVGWIVIAGGVIGFIVFGLLIVGINFAVIADWLGVGWAIAGMFFLPVLLAVAPLYAAIFQHDFTPLLVMFAGLLMWPVIFLGAWIRGLGSPPAPTVPVSVVPPT